MLWIKPQLLSPLLFLWLVRGRWRAVTGAGFGLLSLVASPTATLAYPALRDDLLGYVLAQQPQAADQSDLLQCVQG